MRLTAARSPLLPMLQFDRMSAHVEVFQKKRDRTTKVCGDRFYYRSGDGRVLDKKFPFDKQRYILVESRQMNGADRCFSA